ncbi:hypothetical protein CsSME_00040383 [Camellia sinensis var. sinensis]
MSTCESGGDRYPLSSHSLDPNPSEPDHQLPPDPLLDPGAFIDCDLDSTGPTLTTTGFKEAPNGLSDHHQHGAREPVGDERELLSRPATDASNCTETSATDSTPPRGRRGAPPQAVPVELLPERPKWLPESWVMDCRIRTSGASAGSIDRKRPEWLPWGWWIDYRARSSGASAGLVDKYYFDPVSGRRFRSKKEVDYFLETGSTRKRKRDPDTNSLENSGGRKSSAPLNFEFNDVPENVRWVLTNASRDQWTPFVGDKMVPKSTRKEWNAAFHFSCS